MFLAAWTVHRRGTDRTSAKQVYYRMYNHVPFSMLLKKTKMSVQMAGEKLTRGERERAKNVTLERPREQLAVLLIEVACYIHSINQESIIHSAVSDVLKFSVFCIQ